MPKLIDQAAIGFCKHHPHDEGQRLISNFELGSALHAYQLLNEGCDPAFIGQSLIRLGMLVMVKGITKMESILQEAERYKLHSISLERPKMDPTVAGIRAYPKQEVINVIAGEIEAMLGMKHSEECHNDDCPIHGQGMHTKLEPARPASPAGVSVFRMDGSKLTPQDLADLFGAPKPIDPKDVN